MRGLQAYYTYLLNGVTIVALCGVVTLLAMGVYRQPRAVAFDMKSPPGLLPAAGLYDIESFPDREGRYRWTNGSGVVKLPNMGGATVVSLLLAAGPQRSVHVLVGEQRQQLAFDVAPDTRHYLFLLPPTISDRIALHIDSATINEGNRSLGVLVSDIRLRNSAGQIPLLVLGALLSATIGGFVLLRRAGMGLVLAAASVALAQCAVVAWQGYEGWRYGILGPALLMIGIASLAAVLIDRWWSSSRTSDEPRRATLTRADGIALALIIVIALALRLPFIGARDPVGDIELSARQLNLLYYDGISGAYQFGNDYMPLRLYLLRALGLFIPLIGAPLADPLPVATLALLKLPGLLADMMTLALMFIYARRWRNTYGATAIALLYGLAPPIWINVAWWGQVDAWLMLPLFASVLLLDRAHGRWSWICWALALLIKPQAIIIAPLLYSVTLRRYGCRGLVTGGGLAVGTLLLGCAPVALLQGGAGGIVEAYIGSVERFPLLTNRAFNLWYLVTWGQNGFDVGQGVGPLSYRLIGLMLTGLVTVLLCAVLMRRSDIAMRLKCATTLALAFFLLPTQIHERYLFLSLAFLALASAHTPTLLVPYLALVATATLNILGTLGGFIPDFYRAVANSPWPLVAAVINLLVFILLILHVVATGRGREPLPMRRSVAKTTL